MAAEILEVTRLLPDQHQCRLSIPLAKHGLRAELVEVTRPTVPGSHLYFGKRRAIGNQLGGGSFPLGHDFLALRIRRCDFLDTVRGCHLQVPAEASGPSP